MGRGERRKGRWGETTWPHLFRSLCVVYLVSPPFLFFPYMSSFNIPSITTPTHKQKSFCRAMQYTGKLVLLSHSSVLWSSSTTIILPTLALPLLIFGFWNILYNHKPSYYMTCCHWHCMWFRLFLNLTGYVPIEGISSFRRQVWRYCAWLVSPSPAFPLICGLLFNILVSFVSTWLFTDKFPPNASFLWSRTI